MVNDSLTHRSVWRTSWARYCRRFARNWRHVSAKSCSELRSSWRAIWATMLQSKAYQSGIYNSNPRPTLSE